MQMWTGRALEVRILARVQALYAHDLEVGTASNDSAALTANPGEHLTIYPKIPPLSPKSI